MPQKKNLNAYRGVTKNPKLAKILEDGFNAPVGSTKRKHAQKVFSVLKKTYNDGQGGPGPSMPKVNVQAMPRSVDYSRMLVLPPTPPVRVPIGKKAPPEYHDGKGFMGPGTRQGISNAASSIGNSARSMSMPSLGNLAPKAISAPGKYLVGGLSTARAATPIGLASIPATHMIGSGLKYSYMDANDRIETDWGDPAFRTQGSTPQSIEYLPKGQTATGNREQKEAQEKARQNSNVTWGMPGQESPSTGSVSGPLLSQPSGLAALGVDNRFAAPQSNSDFAKSLLNRDSQNNNQQTGSSNQTEGDGTPSSRGPVDLNTQYSSLVQNAVDNNIGSSMFAYQAMQKGSDYLKQLPGMEDIPEEVLKGGTLSERLKSTDEMLREQYRLDELLNNYSDLVKKGGTIEGQMTDYIRGRDQFLNETDGMISDLKQASMKADMSDPRTQANMQGHMNYLYEMKGRQNKRYVEFLKMSVDEYGSRVSAAENLYKMRYDEYSRALEHEANITKEQYNTMLGSLQEMYETVAQAPMLQLQEDMALAEYEAAAGSIVGDAIDRYGQTQEGHAELYKELENLNHIDSDGRWIPNANSTALTNKSIADANSYIQHMEDAVYRSVINGVKDDDGQTTYPSQQDVQKTVGNAMGHLRTLLDAGYINTHTFNNKIDKLKNIAFQSLSRDGALVQKEQIGDYQKAIEDLDGKKRSLWFNGKKTPSLDEWLSDNSHLSGPVLNAIYNEMQVFTDGGNSVSDFINTYLNDGGELQQGGSRLTPEALQNALVESYTSSFKPQTEGIPPIEKKNDVDLPRAQEAIASIESKGQGDYQAIGPRVSSGAHAGEVALGRYQIMQGNIGPWSQEALGRRVTDQEFLNSPEIQDAIFNYKFGQLAKQHGTPEDAASAWFSGRPINRAGNAQDDLGTSVPQYVSRFQNAYYS